MLRQGLLQSMAGVLLCVLLLWWDNAKALPQALLAAHCPLGVQSRPHVRASTKWAEGGAGE